VADVYEIAERVVDMHKHTPGCSVVPCPCTTCKLARHVLATRGVVEAGLRLDAALLAYRSPEHHEADEKWHLTFPEKVEAQHAFHAAVRAMKEKRDHE